MKEFIRRFDKVVTEKTATVFGPESHWFFRIATHFGDPIVVCIVALVVITRGFMNEDIALMYAGTEILVTLLVGLLLKMLFERARPMTDYASGMWLKTFSFPSGHSSGSTITYGLLGYMALIVLPGPLGAAVLGSCFVVASVIGISRVYLGAHFPSDVIAGWLLGLVSLLAVILVVRPLG